MGMRKRKELNLLPRFWLKILKNNTIKIRKTLEKSGPRQILGMFSWTIKWICQVDSLIYTSGVQEKDLS